MIFGGHALEATILRKPFLRNIRTKMNLPQPIIDSLYDCHVDNCCGFVMLQLSEEELIAPATEKGFKVKSIMKYLQKHGYKLLNSHERTYKLSTLLLTPQHFMNKAHPWIAGTEMDFDIERPTCNSTWFNEYCGK